MDVGERMLVPVAGGTAISRLVTYPPPLEIEADRGCYVLVDDDPIERWHYLFVSGEHCSASPSSGPAAPESRPSPVRSASGSGAR